MTIIQDYLDWRGDVTMDYSPFNEVDNYIVSKIGGPDFTGIVPAGTGELLIGDAVAKYQEKFGEAGKYLGALASPNIVKTLYRLPFTERFRTLKLSGFVKKSNIREIEQFSALSVRLPDGRLYVSFRGTDDTILAWKENFLMSVEESVAAQRDALNYLEWVARSYSGKLVVGGHSKGGNLAIFAASSIAEEFQDRITDVYNNDGPGFLPEFYQNEGYQRIRNRIHTILPRHSLVGTLLTQDTNSIIVNDSCRGAGAHDGFTWEVNRAGFVRSPGGLSKSSLSFDQSINTMMSSMSIEDRRIVIDEIFSIISTTGSATVTDIVESRWKQAKTMAKAFKNSPEVKKFIITMAELLVKDYKKRL